MDWNLIDEESLSNIAKTIRDCKGTEETYKPNEMPEAISSLNKNIKNGEIKSYYSTGESISPDTFVELINNNKINKYKATNYESGANSYLNVSTAKISDSDFLVTYRYYVSGDSSSGLYGTVCHLNSYLDSDKTRGITYGESVFLSNHAENSSLVALSENKALLIYQKENESKIYGRILTINNSNISLGNEVNLNISHGYGGNAIKVANNSVLFAYRRDTSSDKISLVMLTISGDSIVVGGLATGTDSIESIPKIKMALISPDKTLVVYGYMDGTDVKLKGFIAITYSVQMYSSPSLTTPVELVGGYAGLEYDITRLSDNKILVVYRDSDDDSPVYLNAAIATINGTTITLGSGIRITASESKDSFPCVGLIKEGKVLLVSSGGGAYLSGGACAIDSSGNITSGDYVQIESNRGNSGYNFIIPFENDEVVVVHGIPSLSTWGCSWCYIGDKAVSISSTKIDGILETSASGSTAGDVWVLQD